MINLFIFDTHPVQYRVPWFREIRSEKDIKLNVHYKYVPDSEEQGEGFGAEFSWDIPLLEGYQWSVQNLSGDLPSSSKSSLLRSIRSADVAVVTGWYDEFLIRATLFARITGTSLLIRGESNAMRRRSWYKRLVHTTYLRLFDQFLAIGDANRRFYESYGISSEYIHSAPYCVENKRFENAYQRHKPNRAQIRRSLGIPEETTCFLFSGKLIPKKRPGDLLSALGEVSDDSVHGLVVGDGVLADRLDERAHRENLPVTFTGFLNQTEIGRAYTAADVLVLPSNYGETWGLVVNEAMIFECPAIVSDRVGCGPDLVHDGETGYVVPYQDTEALASRIEEMIEHPEHRRQMGERAREQVMKNYTIEAAAEGTVEAIRAATTE